MKIDKFVAVEIWGDFYITRQSMTPLKPGTDTLTDEDYDFISRNSNMVVPGRDKWGNSCLSPIHGGVVTLELCKRVCEELNERLEDEGK